jgi:hypothetical protein
MKIKKVLRRKPSGHRGAAAQILAVNFTRWQHENSGFRNRSKKRPEHLSNVDIFDG